MASEGQNGTDKFGEVNRGQVMQALLDPGQKSGFYVSAIEEF